MPTANEIREFSLLAVKMVNVHWHWIVPAAGMVITLASWRVVKLQIRYRFGR